MRQLGQWPATKMNPDQQKAKWARAWLSKSVIPALKEALSTSNH